MESITEYLLSITAAGIVCAIVRNFLGEKHATGKMIQAVSGVFMAITVFAPVLNFQIDNFESYLEDYQFSAEAVSEDGVQMASDAMADIIKQQTESYISDKAVSVGANIDVEVKMSDTNPPVPKEVILSGKISPYNKSIISQYISANFDIPEENQRWI